jgi:hypothetical protein
LFSSVLPGFIKFMVESEGWRGQTLAQNEATYRMFQVCCGDRAVDAYQRKDLTEFYDLLRSLPKLYSKARQWRGLSLAEIAEQSAEQNIERLAMKTVKRHCESACKKGSDAILVQPIHSAPISLA